MKKLFSIFKSKPKVAVIRLEGMISSGARGGLSDQSVAPLIEKAFSKGKPTAVAFVINSPGGSPVQSSLIAARVRRLAEEKGIPVYAFVEDVAASGGYWLATAADEIYADPASIVGSIGVISAGFGVHEFMERQGIERRVYTAGKSKSMLDPFRAENPEDVARLREVLEQMHEVFINQIKSRRGDKLTTERDLFTGEIWMGEAARDLGLIDGIGHLVETMKDKYGDKTQFRVYGKRKSMASRLGLRVAEDALNVIEERAAFAQFGL